MADLSKFVKKASGRKYKRKLTRKSSSGEWKLQLYGEHGNEQLILEFDKDGNRKKLEKETTEKKTDK